MMSFVPLLVSFSTVSTAVNSSSALGAIQSFLDRLVWSISVDPVAGQLSCSSLSEFNLATYLPIIIASQESPSAAFVVHQQSAVDEIFPATIPVVLEPFENAQPSWQVFVDRSGSGNVGQSSAQAASGTYSAQVTTLSSSSRAQIRVNFSDDASDHSWGERSGSYYWQWSSVYLPSATIALLGANDYITVAGLWPSNSSTAGW